MRAVIVSVIFVLSLSSCWRAFPIDDDRPDGSIPDGGCRCSDGGPCLPDGSCPTSCSATTCAGCCDGDGACQPGDLASACGRGGMLCETCGDGETCGDLGCEPNDPDECNGITCPPGLECVAGGCTCTRESCAGRCCSNDLSQCLSGTTDSACGNTGAVCDDCVGGGMTCQDGRCASAPSCLTGMTPDEDGECVCDPLTCTGCCTQDGLWCVTETTAESCGAGGGVCQDCGLGSECVGGVCSPCGTDCTLGEVSCLEGDWGFVVCGQADDDSCNELVTYYCEPWRRCSEGCLPYCETDDDCGGLGDSCDRANHHCRDAAGSLPACPACDVDQNGCVDAREDREHVVTAVEGSVSAYLHPRLDVDGDGDIDRDDAWLITAYCSTSGRCASCGCTDFCTWREWRCSADGRLFQVCEDHDDDGCLEFGDAWRCDRPETCDPRGCVTTCDATEDCPTGACEEGLCRGAPGDVPCPVCDVDGNGCVEIADFDLIEEASRVSDASCGRCDLDGDGYVTGDDVAEYFAICADATGHSAACGGC